MAKKRPSSGDVSIEIEFAIVLAIVLLSYVQLGRFAWEQISAWF